MSSTNLFVINFLKIHPDILEIAVGLEGLTVRSNVVNCIRKFESIEERWKADTTTLAKLPHDVIRMIIGLSENQGQLRMLCHPWNNIVIEGRYFPLDGLHFVFKENEYLSIIQRLPSCFLSYLDTNLRKTAKADELNRNLVNVETVYDLQNPFNLLPLLKRIRYIKSLWIENVDMKKYELLNGCFHSIQIDRITVRIKKKIGRKDFKQIIDNISNITTKHLIIV